MEQENRREQVLRMLKASGGGAVSGQGLSGRLGISRTAIWKHIQELRKQGYRILSSPRKGYILLSTPDRLLPDEIRINARTHILAKRGIFYFERIGSTNDKAKELAQAGAPEGTLVLAESQQKGRGRMGRSWASPAGGGLYFSLILRPSFPPSEAPLVTLLAGVGVCQAIRRETSLNVSIKWPNDIWLTGRKIAGILTEIEAELDRIHHIVVGIGINVNTPLSTLPAELGGIATSLAEAAGKAFDRMKLFCATLEEMESLWREMKGSGPYRILERWRKMNNTLRRLVAVETSRGLISGRAIDIDENGALKVKDRAGKIHEIRSGDVILIRKGT